MSKTIRWHQRFQNLKKAFQILNFGVSVEEPNILEQQGIIQSFEFTFELSWKTLKDFLESKEVVANYPRDVINFRRWSNVDGDARTKKSNDAHIR